MAVHVIDRVPLEGSVAVVTEDSITVRPSRARLLGPLVQALIAAGAVGVLILLFESLPLWLMMALLLVALVFGPLAVLGLVFSIYGATFLIERGKQTARWQQGFLGLGIGTTELMPFDRMAHIEVETDAEVELSSGQQQDFVRLDIRIVKDNGRRLDVANVVVARSLEDEGLQRALRLARHVGEMTGREVQAPAPGPSDATTASRAAPGRSRRRRRSRRRDAPQQG